MGQREIYDLLKNGAQLSDLNVATIFGINQKHASLLLNKVSKLMGVKKKRAIVTKENIKTHSRSKYEVIVYYYELE